MGSPIQCLREGAGKPVETLRPRPETTGGGERGGVLACARCERPITRARARIEVGGSHSHTFANPGGFAYHIGCFSRASGLAPVGERTTFWSWFPQYSWQIEQCGGCREHLGWLFRSPDHHFHGLILTRLVELEEDRSGPGPS